MALGGAAVASYGAAVVAPASGLPAAAASTNRTGRVPEGLKPGGKLDRLAAELAAKDQFSGSLLVTHRGRTVLSRSHGFANKSSGARNRPDTRFFLASVTKVFTALAVHQLVQREKVKYDEKVGAYLQGFPAEVADKVTVHHLLTHTSGLGNFQLLPGWREDARTWDSAEEMFNGTLDHVRRDGAGLAFQPGAGSLYSNSGFFLLGAIVAAASQGSYYDYMAKHVFEAAEMRDSGFFTKPQWRKDPRMAHPYYQREGQSGWTDGLEQNDFIGLPAGGSFATCADLDRFARALMAGKLLEAPYVQLMLGPKHPGLAEKPSDPGEPPTPPEDEPGVTVFSAYGLGTRLINGQWQHGHSGGSPSGASTWLEFFPGSEFVFAVLGNYGSQTSAPIAELARQLIAQA
jgi:CubicO group peptidase (beta-lactamase class C family)